MKRVFAISFPELLEDSCLVPVTWQSGEHSDLQLTLGIKSYKVHKVLVGHGPRASAFINRACSTLVGPSQENRSSLDLTDLLPEPLHDHIEAVLTFIYTGAIDISEDTVLRFLVYADILQIRSLHDECIKIFAERSYPSKRGAPLLLVDSAVACDRIRNQIEPLATELISKNLFEYAANDLCSIPAGVLEGILARDDIRVSHEDQVFDLISDIMVATAEERKTEYSRLWNCCRFKQVSSERLRILRDSLLCPQNILFDALTKHEVCLRQNFKGMRCLIAVQKPCTPMAPFDFDEEVSWDWSYHLKSQMEHRGCQVRIDWLDSNEFPLIGDPDDQLDVVITDVSPLERDIAYLLNSFVDAGGAVLKVRSTVGVPGCTRLDAYFHDNEPLLCSKGRGKGKSKEKGKSRGKWYAEEGDRKGRFRTCNVQGGNGGQLSSIILCGVRLDGLECHLHTRCTHVMENALAIVEVGDEDVWSPACVVHGTKAIASIWDPLLGKPMFKGRLEMQATMQLMLNLVLVLSHQSKNHSQGGRGV